MSKLFALAALITLAVSTPALAESLTGELRFADQQGGRRADSTEYRIQYADTYAGIANVGAELTVKQPAHNGALTSKVVLKAGPVLPAIRGFQPIVYVEYGRSMATNKSFNVWGAGAGVSRVLYGPVTAKLDYRVRRGVESRNGKETRVSGGLSYALDANDSIGVNYYRTRVSGVDSDALGIGYTRKF